MKGLIQYALDHRTVVYFVSLLLFLGGEASVFSCSPSWNPSFTVKSAVIITKYPGASPKEVELEVTDRLETAIQQMTQVDNIYSFKSRIWSSMRASLTKEGCGRRIFSPASGAGRFHTKGQSRRKRA